MQYITKYRLSIRDKQDFKRWSHSPEFNTIEEVFAAYKDWLAKNPWAVVKFTQSKVFANPTPNPQ